MPPVERKARLPALRSFRGCGRATGLSGPEVEWQASERKGPATVVDVTSSRLRAKYEQMIDPSHRSDDESLLERAATDPDSFAEFYRRHAPAILAYFASRSRNAEDAADLMAETMAAALIAAKRFRRSKGPAVAWLYGIAKNKLMDSHRRGRVELRALSKLGIQRVELDDDSLGRVLELADVGRDASALAAMSDLPADQHHAVVARILKGHDYHEIAAQSECTEALIRQRVSRGLRTLRSIMEDK